jgi:hypothetical protein
MASSDRITRCTLDHRGAAGLPAHVTKGRASKIEYMVIPENARDMLRGVQAGERVNVLRHVLSDASCPRGAGRNVYVCEHDVLIIETGDLRGFAIAQSAATSAAMMKRAEVASWKKPLVVDLQRKLSSFFEAETPGLFDKTAEDAAMVYDIADMLVNACGNMMRTAGKQFDCGLAMESLLDRRAMRRQDAMDWLTTSVVDTCAKGRATLTLRITRAKGRGTEAFKTFEFTDEQLQSACAEGVPGPGDGWTSCAEGLTSSVSTCVRCYLQVIEATGSPPPPLEFARQMREKKIKRCSRCDRVCYCSPECQKADWRRHKPLCKPK